MINHVMTRANMSWIFPPLANHVIRLVRWNNLYYTLQIVFLEDLPSKVSVQVVVAVIVNRSWPPNRLPHWKEGPLLSLSDSIEQAQNLTFFSAHTVLIIICESFQNSSRHIGQKQASGVSWVRLWTMTLRQNSVICCKRLVKLVPLLSLCYRCSPLNTRIYSASTRLMSYIIIVQNKNQAMISQLRVDFICAIEVKPHSIVRG